MAYVLMGRQAARFSPGGLPGSSPSLACRHLSRPAQHALRRRSHAQ